MTLELTAVPLALAAGVVGILSPCVWPLVPVVTTASATSGRSGPLFLALGLSLSFAVAGTLLTFLLVSFNLDPELFRYVAAGLLLFIGLTLTVASLERWMTDRLSLLTGRFNIGRGADGVSSMGQFGVGALLGVVWLPCVGPTLGAAIALASFGQSLGMAFIVMLAYGVGTAGVLLVAGMVSGRLLARWRPKVMAGGGLGKKILGWTLLILGLMVLLGIDKILEAYAIRMLPDWVFTM
jgi:cytochrome c-type biogenesis protein